MESPDNNPFTRLNTDKSFVPGNRSQLLEKRTTLALTRVPSFSLLYLKKFHLFLFFLCQTTKSFFSSTKPKKSISSSCQPRFRSKAINATSKFCFGFSGSGSGSGVAETGFFRQNLRTPGLNLMPVSATISVSISLFLFLVKKCFPSLAA